MIEIQNVEKIYNTKVALSNVSFQWDKGEIVGLLGENGSGKTTMIQIINGIQKATNGQVLCDEENVYDSKIAKGKIAYIRDEQNHVEQYRAKELIKLHQKMYDTFEIKIINELNQFFQLNLNKLIKNYSKGQRMCLAFMIAMAQNADYILMDEPFGGVDINKQKFMKDYLIAEMEKREFGILLSTHQADDVVKLCDKVVFLKEGEVICYGTIDDVIENAIKKYEVILEEHQLKEVKEKCEVSEKLLVGNQYYVYVLCGENEERFLEMLKQMKIDKVSQKAVSLEEYYCYLCGNIDDMKTIAE